MKKYIVNVRNDIDKPNYDYTPLFKNFLLTVPFNTELDDDLKEHNAVYMPLSTCIEFDTEADFLIFKLKFS